MKLFLSNFALGRMLLHLGCICRGGKKQFHLNGVWRELRKCFLSGVMKKPPGRRDEHPAFHSVPFVDWCIQKWASARCAGEQTGAAAA